MDETPPRLAVSLGPLCPSRFAPSVASLCNAPSHTTRVRSKAKIGAALEGLSVKAYIIKLVEAHWQELEKRGLLPKGKGRADG